jgi:flagellar protein FliJ
VAFRFNLEAVLKHRKREEDVAQRDYMEMQETVDLCLREIKNMYGKIDETREAVGAAEKSGTPNDIQFILQADHFIDGQKLRIREARLKARDLIRELEHRQEVLTEKLHERKIMDKLKEKKFEEYKETIAKLEQKEMDDITSARFRFAGRRR